MSNMKLNVLYQSDDNYAIVSGISIASLLENNRHLKEINIYYCGYKLSSKSRNRLLKLVDSYSNARLNFIETDGYQRIFKELKVRPWHGVYVTWLKLLAFGDLPINTDRVLYLNPHTIINGHLDELIDLDFEDNIMALSYDGLINSHKQTIGLEPNDGYYNCGIMLINHKKWVNDSIGEQLKNHLKQKSDYVIADQDLCNVMFRGKIKLLDSSYNYSSAYYAYDLKRFLAVNNLNPKYYYSYDELMTNYYSPKIIHSLFGIKGKPWELGNEHPNRELWRKYLLKTPWKKDVPQSARKTLAWWLYDILPSTVFMAIYRYQVNKKFGPSN